MENREPSPGSIEHNETNKSRLVKRVNEQLVMRRNDLAAVGEKITRNAASLERGVGFTEEPTVGFNNKLKNIIELYINNEREKEESAGIRGEMGFLQLVKEKLQKNESLQQIIECTEAFNRAIDQSLKKENEDYAKSENELHPHELKRKSLVTELHYERLTMLGRKKALAEEVLYFLKNV